MKKSIVLLTLAAGLTIAVAAQVKPAAPGFDTIRNNIAHGKIDTVSYTSKTVGTNRRSLIYTPPGFSKTKKIPGAVFVAWHWWG